MTYTTRMYGILYLGICFTLLLLTFPQSARAYFTTGQEAFSIDGGSAAVFLVEYRFGHAKYALHMPVFAERTIEQEDAVLSFDIVREDGTSARGTASGIVLSSAPLENHGYVVRKGSSASFTLFVVFTPETPRAGEYHLQVSELPFSFDGAQKLKLNQSELAYYTTPAVTLR